MSQEPAVEPTDHDGIDWRWQAQLGESEFHDSLVRAVLRQIPLGSSVLEIGVGSGYLLTHLTRHAKCVAIGLDRLPGAIQASLGTARERGVTLRLLRGSGFAVPIADSAVDVVMSHGVIEHYSTRQTRLMLSEHARVCRPGGLVIVSVPNALDLLHGLRRWVLGRRYPFFPERSYSRWALGRELRAVGLEVIAVDGYAPLWGLRQIRVAYPILLLLHKTDLLRRASGLSSPALLSLIGNLTMCVARKPRPGPPVGP